MSDTPQSADREYHGNCHCGAFKFKLTVPEIKGGLSCNCSICSKNGYVWTYARQDQFTVVKGDENTTLQSYLFGKREVAHKFCPTCGTSVMEVHVAPGSDRPMGVNIRALEGVELDSLKVDLADDGIAMQPPYQMPEPVLTGSVPEGITAYHGSCHCGALAFTLLSAEKITEATFCNCSICHRDGVLWTYHESDTVSWRGMDSAAVEYTFGHRKVFHGFCKTCGVSVFEKVRETNTPNDTRTSLNVRTINSELDLGALEMKMWDGKAILPAYQVD
ncbi:GFA domain-containing protein [Mycena sanguinolenta]|uniref:GFA domain-containing protein n=1 Tax=Mycena sanguinolenta TaxID=230812 RepID=A0A8H7CF28_9AGAR|nr:GFA domain-containing protein [Mycena sanguinolenta]